MKLEWIFEPQGELSIGDNRPSFGPMGRKDLLFPSPQSFAGTVRSYILFGGIHKEGILKEELKTVENFQVKGPFLFLHDKKEGKNDFQLFLPSPRDMIYIKGSSGQEKIYRLYPEEEASSWIFGGTFPALLKEHKLCPLKFKEEPLKGKPQSLPLFWKLEYYEKYLLEEEIKSEYFQNEKHLGKDVHFPSSYAQTHVNIDSTTLTAQEGMLFRKNYKMWKGKNFSWCLGGILEKEDLLGKKIKEGEGVFGAKSRPGTWFSYDFQKYFENLSSKVMKKILDKKTDKIRFKTIYITPALFDGKEGEYHGGVPSSLLKEYEGKLSLKACTISRPEVISGWNLLTKKPKKSRFMVSTGSVCWWQWEGSEEEFKTFWKRIWLESICDDEKDRKDGFGIVLGGVWS